MGITTTLYFNEIKTHELITYTLDNGRFGRKPSFVYQKRDLAEKAVAGGTQSALYFF